MRNFYTFVILMLGSQFVFAQVPFYPTSNAGGRHFGSSIDISGNEIIVSSQSFSLFPASQGSVYLFEQIGDEITQTDNFMPANVALTDGFGTGVSINNDFIAIGSPHHNETGCTYIYKRNGNEWEFIQQLFAPLPTPGSEFGRPFLSGNLLFVTAIEQETEEVPAETQTGVVYIYTFSGTEWVYQESWGGQETINFGEQIRVQDNTVLISGIGISLSKIFHRFNITDDALVPVGISQPFGSLEESVSDFQIYDNKLYLISRTESNQQIQIVDYTTWEVLSTVNLPPSDQIYTSLAVAGDKMFVGSSGYILQVTRKFPVQYFKKIGSEWLYQYSLYGTGPEGNDDYFGQTLALEGENLIIGAPHEGLVLPDGKAYYLNTGSLSTPHFASRSTVLFPNPVSSSFSILTDGIAVNEKIEIFSIHGQLLLTHDGNSATVDVTTFGSGIYFAKIQHLDGTRQTFKFIKR